MPCVVPQHFKRGPKSGFHTFSAAPSGALITQIISTFDSLKKKKKRQLHNRMKFLRPNPQSICVDCGDIFFSLHMYMRALKRLSEDYVNAQFLSNIKGRPLKAKAPPTIHPLLGLQGICVALRLHLLSPATLPMAERESSHSPV